MDLNTEYEKANLGSNDRNQKFLRLMGGSKKSSQANVPHVIPPPQQQNVAQELVDIAAAPTASEPSEEKQDEEEIKINIHTANKWEQVELGDNSRKNKFLRLMGATRAPESTNAEEPTGPANTERKGFDPNQLRKDLEEQFVQGLEFRRTGGVRQHRGFGFVQEPLAPKPPVETGEQAAVMTQGSVDGASAADAQTRESDEKRRERSRRGSRWDNQSDDQRSGERRHAEMRRDSRDGGGSNDRHERQDDQHDRRDDRPERRDDRHERRDGRPERRDDRHERRDDRHERRDDQREQRDDRPERRDDWHDQRDDRRGRETWGVEDGSRGDERGRQGEYRGRRDDRHERQEYKSDPSEYGRASQEQRHAQPTSGEHTYPTQPIGHFQQGQALAAGVPQPAVDWRQPPPPPPPEPAATANQSYRHPQHTNSARPAFGSHSSYSPRAAQYGGRPPSHGPHSYAPRAHFGGPQHHAPDAQSVTANKFPKPMAFVKSSDS